MNRTKYNSNSVYDFQNLPFVDPFRDIPNPSTCYAGFESKLFPKKPRIYPNFFLIPNFTSNSFFFLGKNNKSLLLAIIGRNALLSPVH